MLTSEPTRPDPALGETLDETLPIIGVIAVHGPPVILFAGPWMLIALIVARPIAVLFTLVVLLAAAATLVALVRAILAAPYVLVHRVLRHRATHRSMRAPAASLVSAESRWGVA